MLRKFKIAIDGKEYLVEMEEIGGVQQPVQAPVAAAPAAPVAAPAEQAATSTSSRASFSSFRRRNDSTDARNYPKSISEHRRRSKRKPTIDDP
jgi:hypothetical protein